MNKLDSSLLVCSHIQAEKLLSLGIEPTACFCYEKEQDGSYEFAGEYIGQDNAIPAWTYEELCIMIGGEYQKPDLLHSSNWYSSLNMMQFTIELPPSKRITVPNGSIAAAAMLEYLLLSKEIIASEANVRIQAFISKEVYNPINDKMQSEIESRQARRKK